MKMMFSTMVSLLMMLFLLFIGMSFVTMNLSISQAKAFHGNVIDRLQSSYYSNKVIEQCMKEADEFGYALKIEDITIYDDRKDVLVTLEYTIPGMMLMENKAGTLIGYAR